MESKKILVSLLVAVLGIAVAAVGFVAEAKRVKPSQLTVVYVGLQPECEYPSSPAMGLAIAAIVALILARTIITAASGGCCSSVPHPSKFARFCMVISWITSSIAVVLLIAGAKLSSQKGVEREVGGEYYCYTIRPGVFAGAGIVGLVSVLLGLVYYLSFDVTPDEKPPVDLELQKPPIADQKKPQVPLQKR